MKRLPGGALVIGEQTIAYYNGSRAQLKAISMKSTIVKAYGRIDSDGSRYLLGDHMGNLSVLVLKRDEEAVTDLKLERLGEVRQPLNTRVLGTFPHLATK
jgi:DNA damage-binding protein 1